MTLKKAIGKVHLWLGLTSGLVVFVISLTGCLYAFKTEIEDFTQPYRYVQTEAKPLLPPSALGAIGKRILPGKNLHSVTYRTGGRAAVLTFYHYEPTYYYLAFVNPYSGNVLEVSDMSSDFFYQVLQGHYYLWLPPTIGQPIAASATLIFVVMLITGIVLWWPKHKGARKQRFSVKWKSPWRRRNYDLHNVLGFYAASIALIMAGTGLVWGFQWFAKSAYWATSGGKELQAYYEPASVLPTTTLTPGSPIIDRLWQQTTATKPAVETMEVHFPETKTASIAITTNPTAATLWKTDYRYYDQYTMKELPVNHVYGRFDETTTMANKIARLNYDVHIGAISGLPGKIMAFLASLVSASLPVTGFLLWWGRRKKSKNRPARPVRSMSVAAYRDKVQVMK
ncbi:PepSY-associated TM helix domain-containing protein [Spirosoma utsteinense]|uniref:PepSY-associated TM helix domain-containing protein n=1 Tax=Spirosoma utsteinense TaxID=2585773 RepID=UPI00164783BD|nr:PepSY-associated TM helix domain-containing protein [Spirosoma utsteinense]MBC3788345.1 putative iron-regulated membrane protein [Spirosoma utsteinense]